MKWNTSWEHGVIRLVHKLLVWETISCVQVAATRGPAILIVLHTAAQCHVSCHCTVLYCTELYCNVLYCNINCTEQSRVSLVSCLMSPVYNVSPPHALNTETQRRSLWEI